MYPGISPERERQRMEARLRQEQERQEQQQQPRQTRSSSLADWWGKIINWGSTPVEERDRVADDIERRRRQTAQQVANREQDRRNRRAAAAVDRINAATEEEERRYIEQQQAERRRAAQQEADRLQAAQREAQQAAQTEAAWRRAAEQAARLAAQQQAARRMDPPPEVFPMHESSDVPMTSQDVEQYGQDYFGEAFSGINRFRRNPMQQDETPPRITTSVPAQSATEVTYPTFTRHGPSPSREPPMAPINDDDTYVEPLWNELTNPQEAIVPVEQPTPPPPPLPLGTIVAPLPSPPRALDDDEHYAFIEQMLHELHEQPPQETVPPVPQQAAQQANVNVNRLLGDLQEGWRRAAIERNRKVPIRKVRKKITKNNQVKAFYPLKLYRL
jgi:hypothetical protein